MSLSLWPNKTAGEDLVNLIESARTNELKSTALNGFLRVASESDDQSAMLLGALKKLNAVDTKNECSTRLD